MHHARAIKISQRLSGQLEAAAATAADGRDERRRRLGDPTVTWLAILCA